MGTGHVKISRVVLINKSISPIGVLCQVFREQPYLMTGLVALGTIGSTGGGSIMSLRSTGGGSIMSLRSTLGRGGGLGVNSDL